MPGHGGLEAQLLSVRIFVQWLGSVRTTVLHQYDRLQIEPDVHAETRAATLPNAFWAEFFGTKHLGSIKAAAVAVMVLGSAIGPTLTGILLDFDISLENQYVWISVFFAISSIFMWVGVSKASKSLGS